MNIVLRNNYVPKVKDYCNTLVVDNALSKRWLFDCNGIFVDIGSPAESVVNVLGQSTTAATSQKLVTDNIERIDDELVDVEKKVGILEGRVDDTYTKLETDQLIGKIETFHFAGPYATIGDIPTPYSDRLMYLVGADAPYQIYAYIDGTLKPIGQTDVDLSNFYTIAETDDAIANALNAVPRAYTFAIYKDGATRSNFLKAPGTFRIDLGAGLERGFVSGTDTLVNAQIEAAIATPTVLGSVKIGSGLVVTADGTISAPGGGITPVQTLGQSIADVMSQKAVTDSLYASNSVVRIGQLPMNPTAATGNAVSINSSHSLTNSVLINHNVGTTYSLGSNHILIGSKSLSALPATDVISIGNGGYAAGNSVVIGHNGRAGGSYLTVIGHGLGTTNRATGNYSVTLGYGTVNASSVLTRPSTVYVGDGTTNANYGRRAIANVGDPEEPQDAATKNYVDVGNSYSLTETATGGTWINGKPIYRKVVVCNGLPNNAIKTFAHGIPDVDEMISTSGNMFVTATGAPGGILNSVRAESIPNSIGAYADRTYISISAGMDRSAISANVILEYTKL